MAKTLKFDNLQYTYLYPPVVLPPVTIMKFPKVVQLEYCLNGDKQLSFISQVPVGSRQP